MRHWLDLMPWIPVAPGVPLVQTHVAGDPVTRGWIALSSELCTLLSADAACTFLGNANSIDHGFMRVDLDTPQGFGYALRRLDFDVHDFAEVEYGYVNVLTEEGALIQRYLDGHTTEEDKVWLANALRNSEI